MPEFAAGVRPDSLSSSMQMVENKEISTKVEPFLFKDLPEDTSEAEHLIATSQKFFYISDLVSASALWRTFLIGLKHFASAGALMVDKTSK